MQCFQGKSVYKGIAMGSIVVLKKDDYQVKRTRIEDPEAEVKRVDAALEKSKEQLQKLYDKAVKEVGEASAAIFEVHQMSLRMMIIWKRSRIPSAPSRSMQSMPWQQLVTILQRCSHLWMTTT